MTSQYSLVLRGLSKSYGSAQVLKNIDLSVPRGSVVALLGANGSGKSTLLRIIATLTKPSSGTVEICGVDSSAQSELARSHVGALMHSPMLYGDLTARENLELFAKLCRLDNVESHVETIATRFEFNARLDERVRQLSHGYQKRVAIARATIHSPELLLLDEPETGLDDSALASLDDLITDWRDLGRTVVMATHTAGLASATADITLQIRGGQLIPASDVDSSTS